MIGRVMVWACPEPDCEEFDTLRWHDNCASLACAEEHHPEAVQVQLVPLSEVKEALLGEEPVRLLNREIYHALYGRYPETEADPHVPDMGAAKGLARARADGHLDL